MLLFLAIILALVGTALALSSDRDMLFGLGLVLNVCGWVALTISLIVLGVNYINLKGTMSKIHQRYESLTYQYENDIYNNDNDLGKRDLMEDIQKWNEDLAWYREAQNDFWIGVFIPDIYDQFEYIALE